VDHHAEVFKEELGRVQGVKVKIHMDPQAQLRFIQPLNVPYALKGKVENELDCLEKEAVIEKIQSSDRAAPIGCRQAGWPSEDLWNYKLTINQD